ncbi:MAG: MarR family transcriptional regulator [Acidimicrobiia bacterium]
MPARPHLTDGDYERLLAFRTELRRFLQWSEQQAHREGLTPAQHQLMLAIRGSRHPLGPTIGDVAESLLLRHHSAVGLVDRAAAAGSVERHQDPDDHRIVRLTLTSSAAKTLARLSVRHLEELERLRNGVP